MSLNVNHSPRTGIVSESEMRQERKDDLKSARFFRAFEQVRQPQAQKFEVDLKQHVPHMAIYT